MNFVVSSLVVFCTFVAVMCNNERCEEIRKLVDEKYCQGEKKEEALECLKEHIAEEMQEVIIEAAETEGKDFASSLEAMCGDEDIMSKVRAAIEEKEMKMEDEPFEKMKACLENL